MAAAQRQVGDYVIERGVPLPVKGRWKYHGTTALIRALRKRESVLVPAPQANISSCIKLVKKATGREFTTQKLDRDTTRVWRIA